jgi:hypothetical protein
VIPQVEVRSAGRELSRRLTSLCLLLAWLAAPVGVANVRRSECGPEDEAGEKGMNLRLE